MARRLPKISRLEDVIAQVSVWQSYHENKLAIETEAQNPDGEREHHRKRRECVAVIEFLSRHLQKQRGVGLELLPEDLEGLPEELVAELSITDSDQQELDILKLMEAEGGTISLDLLLVRWYQSKKQVMKRKPITSRLYRMQQKGRVFAVGGTKGVYSLHKQQEMPLGMENDDDMEGDE